MNLILYFINNLLLIFSAYLVSYNSYSLHDRVIKSVLLYVIFILEIVIISGLFIKQLNIYTISVLPLIIFAITCILSTNKKSIFSAFISDLGYIASFKFIDGKVSKYTRIILYFVGITLIFKFFIYHCQFSICFEEYTTIIHLCKISSN